MAGKFEIQKSANGGFRFNLKAGNNQTILSSEIYETKAEAQNGAESVKTNALDDNCYERKTSSNNQFYFVLRAANRETIGTSETYTSEAAMESGIASVKSNAPEAEIMDATGA